MMLIFCSCTVLVASESCSILLDVYLIDHNYVLFIDTEVVSLHINAILCFSFILITANLLYWHDEK